jgi:broad specificity phosphatase PhoE
VRGRPPARPGPCKGGRHGGTGAGAARTDGVVARRQAHRALGHTADRAGRGRCPRAGRPAGAAQLRAGADLTARAGRPHRRAGRGEAEQEPDLVEWDYGPRRAVRPSRRGRSVRAGRSGTTPAWARPSTSWRSAPGACWTGSAGAGLGQDACLIGHGHALRVLAACWLGLEPGAGQQLVLSAGSVSTLGYEHGSPPCCPGTSCDSCPSRRRR